MKLLKLVSLSAEMANAVEEYRWANRIGSESEALRRIIALGLDAIEGRARSAASDTPLSHPPDVASGGRKEKDDG